MALVDFAQVLFDIAPVQRRAAEDHGGVQAAFVQSDEVFFHDDRRFHQQSAHADRVGLGLLQLRDHRVHGLLDPEVVDLVPVVGQDDVHEVFADVVNVPLHGGQHDLALLLAFHFLHVLFEVRHGSLHHFGGLEHERQLHLPAAEQVADDLHPREQDRVDDLDRRVLFAGGVEVHDQGFAAALDDRLPQAIFDGVAEGLPFLRFDFLVRVVLDQHLQRVFNAISGVVEGAFVEQQPAAQFLAGGVNVGQRHDLGSVQNRRVEAVLEGVMQVHAVQHLAGVRRQAERAVRQPDVREAPRQRFLDEFDRVERGDGALAGLLLPCRNGEHQRVEHQVRRRNLVLVHDDVVNALRDLQLPLGGVGLANFVDRQRDQPRPVFLRQLRLRIERLAAVFEVDAVEDRLPGTELERRLNHQRFGAVQHHRLGQHGVVPLDDFLHVADAVPPDVIDAHVQQVNAFAFLLLGHLGQPVPVFLFEQLLELPRAVGVGPLPDQQGPLIDVQFLRRVQARNHR